MSHYTALQMSNLIHSQAGQLATQRLKSQTLQQGLQEELAVSQERIMKQEKEIQWLKKYVCHVINLMWQLHFRLTRQT